MMRCLWLDSMMRCLLITCKKNMLTMRLQDTSNQDTPSIVTLGWARLGPWPLGPLGWAKGIRMICR